MSNGQNIADREHTAPTPRARPPEQRSIRKALWDFYPYILFGLDFLSLLGIYIGALLLFYDFPVAILFSRKIFAIILALTCLGLFIIGGYNPRTPKPTAKFLSEHLVASFLSWVGAFFLIYAFVAYGTRISSGRGPIFVTLLVFPAFSLFYRMQVAKLFVKSKTANDLVVIGHNDSSRELTSTLEKHGWRYNVRVYESKGGCSDVRSLDRFQLDSLDLRKLEAVVLARDESELPHLFIQGLTEFNFKTRKVEYLADFMATKMKMVPLESLSRSWAFSQGFRLNHSFRYVRAKRAFDFFSSLALLFAGGPLLIGVYLLVRMTSEGPVLFTQTRIGKGGTPFKLYKFRTMVVGSENGKEYTEENDLRLTVVGDFLRRTRLDELPQLWNVLVGDMSLIGPRAEWDRLVVRYEKAIPFYHYRHLVKPGITGWAQVNYPYGTGVLDAKEKLKFDLFYVRYFSPVLDLSILIKTIYIVFFGKGR